MFQTNKMTAMDIWMFICIIFVGLAKFEYAVLIKIHFGGAALVGIASANQNELLKSKRWSHRIDFYALLLFLTAYILTVGAYFYIYLWSRS